jgi:hypothetical protein
MFYGQTTGVNSNQMINRIYGFGSKVSAGCIFKAALIVAMLALPCGAQSDPEDLTDCLRLVSDVIVYAGVEDPAATGTGGYVERMVQNTREVSTNYVTEGNLATFKGKNGLPHKHIGIVTSVVRNNDGEVTGFSMIHCGSSTGPAEVNVVFDAGHYRDTRFEGFRAWDTPPEGGESSLPPVDSNLQPDP